MKKVKILTAILLVSVLTACGNTGGAGKDSKGSKGEEKSSEVSKSKSAEVKIEDAFFIEPLGDDRDEDQEYIALNLKVKNTTKDRMHVWEESFYLTEKGDDEKIKASRLDYESKMDSFSGNISPDKSESGYVIFEVDSDKEYTLNFNTSGIDEEGKALGEIELKLDLSKYEDTKEEMKEPEKALQAYIDVVFLQKENDDYEKLVGNDSEADIALIEKEYTKHMKDTFYRFRPTEDQFADAFESYVANQKEAIETELSPAGYVGDIAKVKVAYTGISNQGVSDLIREYRDEYNDKNNDYDSEKQEAYAFEKLEDIYSEAEVGEPRDDISITLTKKDDKWFIDVKSEDAYENQKLLKAYLGNVD